MRDLYFYLVIAGFAITAIYFIIQVVRKHLQYRLIADAKAAGWHCIHVSGDGFLRGIPPSKPARAGNHRHLTHKALRG